MVDLGVILLAAIFFHVKPFLCKAMMMACVFLQVTMIDRGRTMIPKHHPPFEASSLLFDLNQHDRVISSLVLVNTHTCVNERITDMSAGPFVAGLKCSGDVIGIQFICMAKRDFAINHSSYASSIPPCIPLLVCF